jgi:hypothetical protein
MMPNQLTLDDVLETIIIEEEEPSYEAMTRWIARYPQYQTQLVSFFGTWAIQSEQPLESPSLDSEGLASRGVSYALNLLDKRDAAQSLFDRAEASGVSQKELAQHAKLDDSMLQKLNRHLLTGVPRECVRRLALVLNDTLERIVQLITGPPLLAGMRHKAKRKPIATREDFLTAVEHSSLTRDEKDDWVRIVTAEKSSAGEK